MPAQRRGGVMVLPSRRLGVQSRAGPCAEAAEAKFAPCGNHRDAYAHQRFVRRRTARAQEMLGDRAAAHPPATAQPRCLHHRGAHPDLRQCALPEGALHHGQLARTKIQIPIIFVTGHGDIPMLVLAMKAGAVDFLPKPFRDQDMLDAVAAALERDRQRRASETVL
jgi:ActR/RegA family two-component response regulator